MAIMPDKLPSRANEARRNPASTKVVVDAATPHADPGLALAGGGQLGVAYEIGVLNALGESLDDIDFTGLGVYVGVSAGNVLAAGLANGITPREICRLFIEGEPAGGGLEAFDPAMLLQPASREYGRRWSELPRIGAQALRSFRGNSGGNGWGAALARLGQLVPTGLFDNSNIDGYLCRLFEMAGRTNDFRRLRSRLILVATDLDSGEAVEFRSKGIDYVPISRAVQASAALPLLFPPVTIAGRNYVDGERTRADLLARRRVLAPIFARHGITLRLDVLRDSTRTLVPGAPTRPRPAAPVVRDLEAAIASLEAWLRPRSARSAS